MRTLITFVCLLYVSLVWAQEDTLDLREVAVIALQKRIAQETLTPIEAPTGQGAAALLAQHAAVYIKDYGPGTLSTISLRGASAGQTQIIWNGAVLNNPLSGQSDLSLLPGFLIENAAVSQAGNMDGSFGGNVNFSSQALPWHATRAHRTQITQELGSFGKSATRAQIKFKNGLNRGHIAVYREKADNDFRFTNTARAGFPEQTQQNGQYQQQGIYASMQHLLGRSQLRWWIWKQEYDRNLPTIMSYQGAGRQETQEDNDTRWQLQWQHYGKKSQWKLQWNAALLNNRYVLENKVQEDYRAFVKSQNAVFQNRLVTAYQIQTKDFKYALEQELQHETGGFSEQISEQNQSWNRSIYKPSAQVGFANETWAASVKTQVLLLNFNKGYTAIQAQVKHSRKMGPGAATHALTVERNVRIPTLNDLYWFPGGNPNLLPEQALGANYSLQWETRKSPFQWTIAPMVYGRSVSNYILWKPSEFGYWRPQNVAEVYSYGLELDLELQWQWHSGLTILSTTKGGWNQTYDASNPNRTQLMYTPATTGNQWLSLQWKTLKMGLGWQYVDTRNTQTQETTLRFNQLPAYQLFHSYLEYGWITEKLEYHLSARWNNMANTPYQNVLWRAMPGSNVNLSFSLVL